ncbi:helix-turn-helix transcriptional regulator [Streptomyces griseoluteus]|uniref:helix-turn-helix domain-containing protein n=1 Tax=Streptomyces griseoluteus TaxID=29306 RepID=UPI00343945A1
MPKEPPPAWVLARRRDIGERIRDARLAVGLTQEEAANSIGLDRPSWVEIEQGRRNMTINTLIRVLDVVGIHSFLE